MVKIQATIVGYGGKPCTLFSAYDPESRVLAVTAEASYRTDRRDDCMVVTNDPDLDRDQLYSERDLKGAIAAFYELKAGIAADLKSARVVFADRAARTNPEQSIERDGYDVSGPRYRIAEGVTCGQIAALATCLYASRCDTIERAVEASDLFNSLSHGAVVTI